MKETITQHEFWNLPKVIECQNIQKKNRFGSDEHRCAAQSLYDLAVLHGVEEHFETMEEYDA